MNYKDKTESELTSQMTEKPFNWSLWLPIWAVAALVGLVLF